MELVHAMDFDTDTGLVPAVVQADDDGRVLMLAYMDRRALERTLERGRVTFWSRSRQELWEKGETSGNWLEALEVRADCDRDALLVRARPHGPACHTGQRSCFDAGPARELPRDPREAAEPAPAGAGAEEDGRTGTAPAGGGGGRGEASGASGPPADAEAGGGSRAAQRRTGGTAGPDLSDAGRSPAPVLASVLEELVGVVARRDRERPEGSHTAALLEGGESRAARKVGEEALEAALAAVDEPGRLARESADLLYHLVVLWRAAGLPPDAVGRELADRRNPGEGPTAGAGDEPPRAGSEP